MRQLVNTRKTPHLLGIMSLKELDSITVPLIITKLHLTWNIFVIFHIFVISIKSYMSGKKSAIRYRKKREKRASMMPPMGQQRVPRQFWWSANVLPNISMAWRHADTWHVNSAKTQMCFAPSLIFMQPATMQFVWIGLLTAIERSQAVHQNTHTCPKYAISSWTG